MCLESFEDTERMPKRRARGRPRVGHVALVENRKFKKVTVKTENSRRIVRRFCTNSETALPIVEEFVVLDLANDPARWRANS